MIEIKRHQKDGKISDGSIDTALHIREINAIDADAINTLVIAARNGDDAAYSKLLDLYEPLILSIVKNALSFLPPGESECIEEFRQEADIKFYEAILSYNTEQNNTSFGLYAKICLKNKMISLLRSYYARRKVTGADIPGKNGSDVMTAPDPCELIAGEEEAKILLERAESVLSPLEKSIFSLYTDGKKTQEIAAELSITKKTVENAVYRIKKKLRKIL